MPVFDLAYHKIQVSLLIFRSTADMRAVQEYCQTTFGNRVSAITRRPAGLLEFLRNPTQSAAHCHVIRWVAGKETLHQSRGFPKGMPGRKLGMQTLQLRSSADWKEADERRNRPAGERR